MSVPALALKSLGDEPVAENFVRDLSMELGLNMKSSASLPPPRTSGAEHNLPFSMSINSSQQELAGNGHAAKQRSGDEQMSGGSGFVANRWTDGLGQPPLHGGWDAPFQPLKADEAQSTYYYGNGSDERPVHTPVANFSDLTPREGAPGNASAMDAAALAMPPLRSGSGSATPALGSSPRLHPSSNPCSPRLPLVASNSSTPRGNTQPPSGSGGSHTEILLEKAKTGRGSDVASPNSPSEYSHGRHPPARSRLGGAGRMSLELDENRHTPRSNLSGAGSLASNGAVASDWNVSSDLDADRHTPRSNLSGAGSLASNGAVASDWNVSSNGAVQLRSKSGESEPLLNKGKKRIMLSTVKLGGLSDPAQETTNSFTIPANHGDGSDLKPVEVASDLILSKGDTEIAFKDTGLEGAKIHKDVAGASSLAPPAIAVNAWTASLGERSIAKTFRRRILLKRFKSTTGKAVAFAAAFKKRPRKSILKDPTNLDKKGGDSTKRQRLVSFTLPKKEEVDVDRISFLGIMVPVVLPESKFHTRWSNIMVIPLVYELWAIPFRWAVTSPDTVMQLIVDAAMDAWFALDMGVQLCTAVVLPSGEITIDKDRIRSTFFRKRFFIHYAPALLLYITDLVGAPIWLWACFERMAMDPEINARRLQVLKLMIIIYGSCHWVGCLFFFLARIQNFNENTWVSRLSDAMLTYYDPQNASLMRRYLLLIFKGGNGMTNFGYDPERPDNPWEMLFAMVVIVFQLFLAAYILGTLFHHLVAKDEALEEYRRKVSMLQQFMNDRNLPNHLKSRLHKYLEFTYSKSKDSYSSAIDIPRALDLRIASCQYKDIIDTCMVPGAPLRGCNEQFINTLLLSLNELYLMPGEVFIHAGDVGRELGFVMSGILDVVHKDQHGDVVLRSVNGENLELPTIIGEIAFFLSTTQPYKIACRSTGDACILTLARGVYNDMLTDYPEQQEAIVSNILANYGFDSKGNPLPGWTSDAGDDDEIYAQLRQMVLEAVMRQQDDLTNQFTYAVNQGEVDQVKTLIRKGANVDTDNYDHSSMCHLAAVSGNVKVLEVLLEEGANKDIVNRWGETPLHQAVVSGNLLAVETLTKAGASLSVSDPAGALCTAASNEDITQLGRLVDNGINPNLGDYDARTAMHLAAASGAQKSVEYLLNHSGDPNTEDRWGKLPLWDAVKGGHHMVALILKRHGGMISKDASQTDNASQLCKAATADDVRQLQLLKDAGVDLNQGDYDGRFALHLAASKGRLLATSYLLSICADPNVQDRWSGTPVEDALRNGHLYCAKLLAANGGMLGPRATPELRAQYDALDSVSLHDMRQQIKEMHAKQQDKPVTEILAEEIHGRGLAAVKCIEALRGLAPVFLSISETQKLLSKRVNGAAQNVWELVKVMTQENVLSEIKGHDSGGSWGQKYKSLENSFQSSSRSVPLANRVTQYDLLLYAELDDLAMDSESESNSGDHDGGSQTRDGDDIKVNAAEMAKTFQSQVVTQLQQLQEGFDDFLDEFYIFSRNEDYITTAQLQAMLQKFKCSPSTNQMSKIIREASQGLMANDKAAPPNTISFRALWVNSASFWEILKNLPPPRAGNTSSRGVLSRLSSLKSDSDDETEAKPEETVKDAQVELKRQVLCSSRAVATSAFHDLAGGGQKIKVAALKDAAKHLGEFGAPVFKHIFPSKYLDNRVTLSLEEFLGTLLQYLDPSGGGEEDEDENSSTITELKAHSSFGLIGALFQKALHRLNKAIDRVQKTRLPLSVRALMKKVQERNVIRNYDRAFLKTMGTLEKPMRRQNIQPFLMELLPRYIIREVHVEEFLSSVTDDVDGLVTWEQLSAWLSAEATHEAGDEAPQTSTFLSKFVIMPHWHMLKGWDALLRWMAVYQFLMVPLQIASPKVQSSRIIFILNMVTDSFFIADIFVSFLRAFYDSNSILVTDLQKIFNRYTSGRLLIDFPLAIPLGLIATASDPQTRSWLSLPKVLRMHLVYSYAQEVQRRAEAHSFRLSVIRLVSLLGFVAHILACIFLYLGEHLSGGWLSRGVDYAASRDAAVQDQYLLALYYVLATLSSEGNVGELIPSTEEEVFFCFMLMIINMTLFAYILGEVSSLVLKMDNEVAEARAKQSKVDNFIKSKRGITNELALDIRSHANNANRQGSDSNSQEVYRLLSHSLQVEVAAFISRDSLDNVPLFRGCSGAFLDSLSVYMREARHAKDDMLFRQNEVASEMYIVVSGTVDKLIELEDDEPYLDGKISPGECCGELSFFFAMRHIYTAKVSVPEVQTFFIERAGFQQLLKMYHNEGEVISHNALTAYKTAWNRAGSAKSGASGKSAKSVQETMDELVGGNLKHMISMLRRRQELEAIEKAMKYASRGSVSELKKQLDNGVGVNATNHDKRTCLHIASCQGHTEMVTFLLDVMGADFSIVDLHGNVPMNDAVRHKQDEVADILRAHGATLRMGSCDAAVLLCQAAFANDLKTIQRYIKNGISPNVGDYDGRTPLHLAACEGRLGIVDYLLEQNVDVNLRDRFGNTALEDAIRHGHREVQKKLRSNGAVLHGHAVTLCQAAAKGDIDTIRVLIENGVDPNEGDYDGRTCLHLAACEGQLGVLHFLLTCHLDPSLPYAQKVNVNCVDSMGGTPLDDAIRHNQSVVEMILRQAGGVCQEDAEAMQDANRAQEKANQVRFNAEAQLVAKGILAKCREPKVAAQVQAYLSSLQGFVNELDTGYIELVTGLKDLVHVWKDAAAKKSLKPSDWTKKQAAIMEKLQHLMPLLSEWNSAIDNPPGLSPPVFNLLARRKDSDEGGGQQGREMGSGPADENMDEIDEVDYKESCLEAIDRLAATLECLHLMLGSRD